MMRPLAWSIALCLWAAAPGPAGETEPPRSNAAKVPAYYLSLARIHADFNKFDEAAACYRQAIALEKDDVKRGGYRIDLAAALIRADRLDDAARVVQEAIDAADGRAKITVCTRAAKLYQDVGKLDQAEQILTKAMSVAATPRDRDAARLGYLQFLKETNRADRLAAEYLQRLKDNPNDPEAIAWMAEYYLSIENDIQKGLETYEKLLALSANDAHVAEQVAVLYLATGKADKAIELYLKILELDKTKAAYVMEQVACIEASQGHVEKAIEWNRKILEAGGETPDVLYRLAKLHRQANDLPRAIECLEKAVKGKQTQGAPPDAYVLDLIDAYQAAGRIEDAIREAERLVASAGNPTVRNRARSMLMTLLRERDAPPKKP